MRNPNSLPIARLRELFTLDAATGKLYWKVATSTRVRVGDEVGSRTDNGYLATSADKARLLVHRVVFAMHHGAWPAEEIDHIDGTKDNNAVSNLREASSSQNKQNTVARSTSTTGVKGVSWYPPTNKWQARITVHGKCKSLGYFYNIEDAKQAYATAVIQYHGEFARDPT